MELEDLKTTWQSVKPSIKNIEYPTHNSDFLSRKKDIKSRLLKKILFGILFTFVCLILLATSHLWSLTKFSALWLGAFCSVIVVAIICSIGLYSAIRHINLWEDSNSEIMTAIIKVKRRYQRIELGISIMILPLILWLSLTPPFINSLDMYIVWGLTAICFTLEYLWYRSNIKQINNLVNWEKEP